MQTIMLSSLPKSFQTLIISLKLMSSVDKEILDLFSHKSLDLVAIPFWIMEMNFK